jgi:hypothetical protein
MLPYLIPQELGEEHHSMKEPELAVSDLPVSVLRKISGLRPMSSTPASLRDLYNPSPGSWTFLPPPPGVSQQISSPPSSYRFPAQGATSNEHGPEAKVGVELMQSLLLAAAAQYASTALAMPIEVGKMLLQVQWVPREDGLSQVEDKEGEEEEGKEVDEV